MIDNIQVHCRDCKQMAITGLEGKLYNVCRKRSEVLLLEVLPEAKACEEIELLSHLQEAQDYLKSISSSTNAAHKE